jgi:N-acetylglucosaminyldiphosphoundecaprenol N-acetyl-beta-D-mannosaminyltransferase
MRKLLIILGVPIDDLTMGQALDRIDEFVQTGRTTGRTHQVATINADFVVNSLHDPELQRILQESDMATADGMPLVWGARLLGVPIEDRVTGADMVPALAERAAERDHSLFLLGARPGVAAQAADILVQRHPALKIAGVLSPPQSSVLEMDPSIIETIRAARPDILLVAFGNPKQEKFINMYARQLQVPVMIGVGGTFDMIAGVTRRAPQWMQKSGLEWVYRLAQEPQRLWKRYVHDMLYFGSFFVRQWWEMRKGNTIAPVLPAGEAVLVENSVVLNLRGRLDVTNREAFAARAEAALNENPHLVISMDGCEFLDSSALGALVVLANRARAGGGALTLVAVPPPVMQILQVTRLDRFFNIEEDVDAGLHTRHSSAPVVEPTRDKSGWQVVKMPRLLDASNASELTATCEQLLARQPRLVLDFSETHFLSSAGLAAMMRLDRQARELAGGLRIAACSRDVLRSIQLVKLDTLIPVFSDVQQATGTITPTLEVRQVGSQI